MLSEFIKYYIAVSIAIIIDEQIYTLKISGAIVSQVNLCDVMKQPILKFKKYIFKIDLHTRGTQLFNIMKIMKTTVKLKDLIKTEFECFVQGAPKNTELERLLANFLERIKKLNASIKTNI